jgi:hypothetical protein
MQHATGKPQMFTSLIIPDFVTNSKDQALDTGMLNYFGGFQKELFGTNDIDAVFQGKIAEHIVGQELLTCQTSPLYKLHF